MVEVKEKIIYDLVVYNLYIKRKENEDQNLKIMLMYLSKSSQHPCRVMIWGWMEWCESTSISKEPIKGTNWVYYKV